MPDCLMPFPEDWHDFLKDYSFDDSQEVYTNGSRLIPVFRVEQLIKHLLKAQEPVMVEERADTDTINCPKCGQQFARVGRDKSIYLDTDEEPNYCPKCGQAVKWE